MLRRGSSSRPSLTAAPNENASDRSSYRITCHLCQCHLLALADLAGSESEQVGDQFPDLLERDGPDILSVVSTTRSTADGRRQVRLGHTESGDVDLAQHPRLVVVQGTTTIACCRNSSTSSEVTTMAGRNDPGSPRAGVPKSQRTTSPARLGDIARRRIEHGLGASIERGTSELGTDDATTFPSDQLLDLCVEGEALTIGELAKGIPRLDGYLNGSRIRHI